jgi:hypothetical protein
MSSETASRRYRMSPPKKRISRSVSDLANYSASEALAEDADDIAAFENRAKEPVISYYDMVKRLKKEGRN